MFWKRKPLLTPTQDPILNLHGDDLADEKIRVEINKLRVELLDENSWHFKLLVSLIVPAIGVLAFFNTWNTDRSADRTQRSDQTYSQAAQQLSNPSPSVRLNAVIVLASYIDQQTWFQRQFGLQATKADCDGTESLRGRQSIALIIGDLNLEQDPSVLDEIASVARQHPCLVLDPLLSLNRTAAVHFARTAGDFLAFYLLRKGKTVSLEQGESGPESLSQQNSTALDAVTTRTGSPFEAQDKMNQTFLSSSMVTSGSCPFGTLYNRQFELTSSSALNSPLLANPPSAEDVRKSMQTMEDAASMLEKTSYVLTELAKDPEGLKLLKQQTTREKNLYGVAIVVTDLDKTTAAALQLLGAYVQQLDLPPNTCPLPQSKPLGQPSHN